MAENGKRAWIENFRVLTPVLLLSLNVLAGVLISNESEMKKGISAIDEKLFKHLTNDEIHTPKSIALSRPEFNIYQEMRSKEMSELRSGISDIKIILENHRKEALEEYRRVK